MAETAARPAAVKPSSQVLLQGGEVFVLSPSGSNGDSADVPLSLQLAEEGTHLQF